MNNKRIFIAVIVALFVFELSVNAQINISSISVKIGSISTFQTDAPYASAFNPEIEVGGVFLTKYFNWDIYWSYWDDGVNKMLWFDSPVYNCSSHILGCRMRLSLKLMDDSWIIPLEIFAGVAEHFIKARCLSKGWGETEGDFSKAITTGDLGLSLPINIIGPWNIFAEAQMFLPFDRDKNDKMKQDRMTLKIGVKYVL
jgi:hypothetical protein